MKHNKQAFTLIELLVVVLIIGILAAIALPQYEKAVEKSRVAEAMVNVSTIKQQIGLYLLENGKPKNTTYYKDFASVDLSGGQWSGNTYSSKYFSYFAVIYSSGDAEIRINRLPDTQYTFKFESEPGGALCEDGEPGCTLDAGWYNICVTQETNIGRAICKQYQTSGYRYMDTNY